MCCILLLYCSSLLTPYDSSTAVSAVTGRSGVLVTVLGHCQALPYDPVTASVKDFYQMWKFPEQCSKHCLPVLSLCVLLSQESFPSVNCGWGTRSLLRTPWDSVLSTGTKFFTQTRRISAGNFRCNTSIKPMLHHYMKKKAFIK